MATPYVVPKMALTKNNDDYDHCRSVDGSTLNSCTANIPHGRPNLCKFTSPWCAMCARETKEYISVNESCCMQSFSKDLGDGRHLIENNAVTDCLKVLKPVSLPTLNSESLSKCFETEPVRYNDNFSCNSSLYFSFQDTSRSDAQKRLPSEATGIQGKYVNQVEVLKGKIQEVREKLHKQFSEQSSFSSNGYLNDESKVKNQLTDSAPSYEGFIQGSQIQNVIDLRRVRKISDLEKTAPLGGAAGLKRHRDVSPEKTEQQTNQGKYQTSVSKVKTTSDENCLRTSTEIGWKNTLPTENEEAANSPLISKVESSSTLGIKSVVKGSCTLHPSLRPSLFPKVPPYIKFVALDSKVEKPLPASLAKVLRWKITTITPLVVRKTVTNSGFKLVRQSPDWVGTWGKHMRSIMFRTIRVNQKINHFPGSFQIGRKDKLWQNLHHLMSNFSKKEFGFMPRTYILPQDSKTLRVLWDTAGGSNSTWIVKPPASARGTGISLVNKWAQIPKKAPLVVQKYISNPYLINGNKFDLRLYALVTCFNPLRIYLYDNGLVRFASVKYSDDQSCLSDRYMHLTNYSINKQSNNYHHNEDADSCQGHKWTIKSLWAYLEGAVDVKVLQQRLTDLVVKTMLCGEKAIGELTRSNLPSRYNSYELFGVDVLLDETLRPWLLEVNISPSLHSASPLDLAVKGAMIQDILNMAGYQIPDLIPDNQKTELCSKLGIENAEFLCYNKDLFVSGLSPSEKAKHNEFYDLDRSEYLKTILNYLTGDDVRHLIQYEDELTQIGSFKKVFPTSETHEYLKYFESPQYYNKLFDAWETKYCTNREEGINVLRKLCEANLHLDVDCVTPYLSTCAVELAIKALQAEADAASTDQSSVTQTSSGEPKQETHAPPTLKAVVASRRRRPKAMLNRQHGRLPVRRLRSS